jgi:hypothetical protein
MYMPRGSSGRIVIEVDPGLKRELYVQLARRDLTLKAWFVSEAESMVAEGGQLLLFPLSGSASRGQTDAPADEKGLSDG